MTSNLIIFDLVTVLLAAVAWLAAGVMATARRAMPALALAALAALLTLVRIGVVVALADSGWWFVQEKAELELPLQCVTAAAAVVLSVPRLVRAVKDRGGSGLEGESFAVPLFAAGYTAAASLVLTLLIGYPATVSVGLIAVAVIIAAVLITWRVLDSKPSGIRLGSGGIALVVGLIGVLTSFAGTATTDAGGGSPVAYPATSGVSVASLTGPSVPETGGVIRRYTLDARTATVALASGKRVQAWTFNGQVPGPPITAVQGDLIEVTLHNVDIKAGVTIHWHGYDVPAAEDGAAGLTQNAVAPGGTFVYRFLADEAGTYWYHTHQDSNQGIQKGLYGALVVTPRGSPAAGADLTLPVHTFASVTALGTHDGVDPQQAAPGTQVRLRLINTDNDTHRITLTGAQYRLVAADGHDLNGPGTLSHTALSLPAGGRYDLVLTMPKDPVAVLIDDNKATGLRLTPSGGAQPTAGQASTPPDTSAWPDLDLTTYGTAAAQPISLSSDFDRQFTLVLDRGLSVSGGAPGYDYTVNGQAFPDVPTLVVREGDLVEMTVVNRGLATHPWHLHGHSVQVLSKNGHPVTGSPLLLDTFEVKPGEVWKVAFRADNPGLWMVHCHNLVHAGNGMSLTLAYAGITEPFDTMDMNGD